MNPVQYFSRCLSLAHACPWASIEEIEGALSYEPYGQNALEVLQKRRARRYLGRPVSGAEPIVEAAELLGWRTLLEAGVNALSLGARQY